MADHESFPSTSPADSDIREAPGTSGIAARRRGNPNSLLLAKLRYPPLPRDNVSRPRLVKTLARVPSHPLTLVSAPTGFGKSTVMVDALTEMPESAAWLTVDEYDNDLLIFLDYLIAAIQTQFPDACTQTQRLLDAVQPPPFDYMVSSLLNELQAIPSPVIVALDDFHHLTDPAIHQFFTTLLRVPLPNLHLVVMTQVDPPWPLARLAGRGQLLEIRATDLRFRRDEAQEFLDTVTGVALPPDRVESLVEQTEGWIVALRLAALAIASESDRAVGLNALTAADERLSPRYLVHEVLARQAPATRNFLLRTAILDRFNASLCSALMHAFDTDPPNGPGNNGVEALLRSTNLFIVPLDDTGEWYRFHYLFRELLRHELTAQWDSESIATLHRRATDWYAEHGFIEEALRHALAAGDTGRAADIMEPEIHTHLNHEDWRGVERWLALLPAEVIRQRPALLLAQAWVLVIQDKGDSVPPLLAAVESLLADAQLQVSDETRRTARAEIDAILSYSLLWRKDQPQACLERARSALAGLPRDYYFARSVAIQYEALALYVSGQHMEAVERLRRVVDAPDEPGVLKARPLLSLCSIYRVAGPVYELEHAISLYLKMAEEEDLRLSGLWARYLIGSLHYERNELEEAIEQFQRVVEERYLAHVLCARDTLLELALAYQALGRTHEANEAARTMAQFCLERSVHSGRESLALRIRLALARGETDEAMLAAAHLGGIMPTTPMFLTFVPAITRAQALILGGGEKERQQAFETLTELEALAVETHTLRPLARILALQAVGLAGDGREPEALARLERAVEVAEPLGLIRTFVDVGPFLAPLLKRLLERGVAAAYLRQVVAAFPAEAQMPPPARSVVSGADAIEPLTDRELDILLLLGERLSNKEIAGKLYLSPLTVKRHVSNLLGKLGVHDRREAVDRARAMGLLPPR
ncbi:MAG: LuxR C-terminal-related transcriptional regulator [Anaerolineae bacterium]